MKTRSRLFRSTGIVLLLVLPLLGWLLYAVAADVYSPNLQVIQTDKSSASSVTVNRTVPQVQAPSGFQLSDSPTDDEIARCSLFSEPLVPMTKLSAAASATSVIEENQQLSAALHQYAGRHDPDDVSALTGFCERYPDSRWRVGLLYNLGQIYYFQGYYSKVLVAWEQAWDAGRTATAPEAIALVNQTVTELGRMYARLGRVSQLQEVLGEMSSRHFLGGAAAEVTNLKDALALMKHDPGHSFRCGPLALAEIRSTQHLSGPGDQKIAAAVSTSKGCSLIQVADLAEDAGMKYQIAKRDPGAAVIIPAVIHWKVGHYAALVAETNGKYLSKDLTFNNNIWITSKALDQEASGYFLVPAGPLPAGWHPLTSDQVANVWGCGQTNNNAPGGESGNDPGCGCGGDGMGMAHYDVKLQAVSLTVFDTPVGYNPPVGPASMFTVRYEQRADGQPATFNFSNIGPNWFHDWMAYIVDDPTNPGADVNLFPRGGGYFTFSGYNTSNQTYALDVVSNTTLVLTSATSYERLFPDGSIEIYGQPNGVTGAGRQVFLTEVIDPQGNKLTFTYDSQYRLVAVRDAIGQVTRLRYGLKADPLKITSVTDPFGRVAKLAYTTVNGTLMLSETTDVMGNVSKYEYDGGFLHQLTTPYGKTQFYFAENFGDIGTGRSVDIYDPAGGHSRVEYNQNVNYPFYDSLIPSGMNLFNEYLNFRDTFFWDQHAMAVAPYVYTQAVVYHFQHTPDGASTSRLLEATCNALESRVWRNYPGQGQSGFQNGVYIGKPSLIGRVLDSSGATQLTQYTYNSLANVTAVVDPAGRITKYTYAPNGIDVVQTQQWDGSTYQTVESKVYNSQHLPTQITDAAGQTTHITYNKFGEVTTITNPKHELTKYNYDDRGYLQSVVNALATTQASYTYDSVGRVRTFTDVNGFNRTYTYDNLDRITALQYPDGTSETNQYQAMSLVQATDRLNRVTQYKYNSLQQMVEMIDPLGHDTQYSYCECGALTGITDGNGNTTAFVRDIENRVIDKVYADNSMVSFNYDLGSRLSSMVDAKNQTTTYHYGTDNLLDEVSYAPPTPGVAFSYDAYGHLASMTDGTGTTSYSYWNPGQLGALQIAAELRPAGYGTVYYNYDQVGRVIENQIYDTAGTLDKRIYTYDAIGRPVEEQNNLGASIYQYVASTPRLQTIAEPNKQTFSFQYNGATGNFWLQQIQQVTGTNTLSHQYTYDAVGNILSWQQTNPADGTGTWNLTYDADNEVSTFTANATGGTGLALGQGNYSGDGGTNLTQFTTNGTLAAFQSATYQINTLNQVTSTTDGPTSISYDANGNPLDGIAATSANPNTVTGALSYSWDGANRLIGITYSGAGNSTAFNYDGFGRLVQVTETTNGKSTSNRLYVWMGNATVEQRSATGAITKEYFPQGFEQGGKSYFYGMDHLGSIHNVTDSTGAIQTQIDYGLYGEVTRVNGTNIPDFAYTGLFYHQRSGLYFAGYRAYDTGLKRWLNRDPMFQITGDDPELQAGPNLYAYVKNGPTTTVDRSGLVSIDPGQSYPPNPPPAAGTVVYSKGTGNTWVYNGNGTWNCTKGPAAGGIRIGTRITGGKSGSTDTILKVTPYKRDTDPPPGFSLGGTGVILPPGGNNNGGDNSGGNNNNGNPGGNGTGTNSSGNAGNTTQYFPPNDDPKKCVKGQIIPKQGLHAPPAGKL